MSDSNPLQLPIDHGNHLPAMPQHPGPSQNLPAMPPNWQPPEVVKAERLHHEQIAAAAIAVVLIVVIALARKKLQRFFRIVVQNKSRAILLITAIVVALEILFPPEYFSRSLSHFGTRIDSVELLVRIIGTTIVGFLATKAIG